MTCLGNNLEKEFKYKNRMREALNSRRRRRVKRIPHNLKDKAAELAPQRERCGKPQLPTREIYSLSPKPLTLELKAEVGSYLRQKPRVARQFISPSTLRGWRHSIRNCWGMPLFRELLRDQFVHCSPGHLRREPLYVIRN